MNAFRRLLGTGRVRSLWLTGLFVAGFLGVPCRCEANPEVRKKLHNMAETVANWLKEQGQEAIVIGPMVAPPSAYPSPGLRKMLAEELAQQKIRVALKADRQLVGKYHAIRREDARPLGVRFSLEVADTTNKPLRTWDFELRGAPEIAFLLGLTTATPPSADPAKTNQRLDGDRQKPPARLERGMLGVGSYALEVLVGDKPRPITMDGGQPFVSIEKGETYAVRLINKAGHEAAVWLAIDGLSVFAFDEDPAPDGQRRDSQVLVPSRGTAMVRGWYRGAGKTDAFLVTDYAKSAAALKNSTAKVGMITAQFRACWEKDSEPPTDEILDRGLGTGFGPTITERWVYRPRKFGAHRATITVRYAKQ